MLFDGFHAVPKRNLKTPISFMAGIPFANMNTHIKIVENIDTHGNSSNSVVCIKERNIK